MSAFIGCSEHMNNYCTDKLCCYLSLYDIYYYCCYLLPSLSPVFSVTSFPHQLRSECTMLWPSCTASASKPGTSAQQHAAGVCGGALGQLSPAVSINVLRSAAQCREAQHLTGKSTDQTVSEFRSILGSRCLSPLLCLSELCSVWYTNE